MATKENSSCVANVAECRMLASLAPSATGDEGFQGKTGRLLSSNNASTATAAASEGEAKQDEMQQQHQKKRKRESDDFKSIEQSIIKKIKMLPIQNQANLFPTMIEIARKTKQGRNAFAKAILTAAGKPDGRITLSNAGTSRSARHRSYTTLSGVTEGLAAILNPDDMETTLKKLRYVDETQQTECEESADVDRLATATSQTQQLDEAATTFENEAAQQIEDLRTQQSTFGEDSQPPEASACDVDEKYSSPSAMSNRSFGNGSDFNDGHSSDESVPPTIKKQPAVTVPRTGTFTALCQQHYCSPIQPQEDFLSQTSFEQFLSAAGSPSALQEETQPNADEPVHPNTTTPTETLRVLQRARKEGEERALVANNIENLASPIQRRTLQKMTPMGGLSLAQIPEATAVAEPLPQRPMPSLPQSTPSRPPSSPASTPTSPPTNPPLTPRAAAIQRLREMMPPTAELRRYRSRRHPSYLSRKSMQGATKEKVQKVRDTLGPIQLAFIRKLQNASDRRPFLASLWRQKYERSAVCLAIWGKEKITKQEWARCGLHCKWPGPYQPVRNRPIHRMRVPQEVITRLLRFLDAPGNLQQYAFGQVIRETFNGRDMVELGLVDRLHKLKTITQKFLTGLMAEMQADGSLDAVADRCQYVERNAFCRCLKERGHSGNHKYTPKSGVCANTIKDLVGSLTGGDIKALSGLDDVKVEKGRDNFASLKELAKQVCEDHAALSKMCERIDKVELFYQTDFQQHLMRKGSHKCNCLTCGFVNQNKSYGIECRSCETHQVSCTRCTEGFAVIEELQQAIKTKRDKKLNEYRFNYNERSQVYLQQECASRSLRTDGDISALVSRLETDDAREPEVVDFTKLPNKTLSGMLKAKGLTASGNKDALVQRLQSYDAEERQVRVPFRLRALTCDEQVMLDELEERVREIEHRKDDLQEYRSHLARHKSEDDHAKKQMEELKDDECIVTADYKMKILSCFFRENQKKWFGKRGTSLLGFMITQNSKDPEDRAKGIKDVRFVMMTTDDVQQDQEQVIAAKAMLYRDHLPAGIKKVHFTADGAGCFRSKLHRAIQPFWKIWEGVDEISYRITPAGDGKSPLDGMFGRLSACLAAAVDQGSSHYDAATTISAIEEGDGLAGTHFLQFNADRSQTLEVELKSCSLDSVLLTTLNSNRSSTDQSTLAYKHSSYGTGLKLEPLKHFTFTVKPAGGQKVQKALYDEAGKIMVEEVMSIRPKCTLYETAKTLRSQLSARSSNAGEGAGSASVRSEVAKNRVKKHVQNKQADVALEIQEKRDAGLFVCDARDEFGRYCRGIWLTKANYKRHVKHDFPKGIRARDWLLNKCAQPGGLLAPGRRPDRMSAHLDEAVVSAESGSQGEEKARCKGKFNRKEGYTPYTKPKELVRVLNKLYDVEPKLDAKQMLAEMKKMRDPAGGLLFTYRKRFKTGMILTESQITQWISARTQTRKKSGRTDIDNQQDAAIAQLTGAS